VAEKTLTKNFISNAVSSSSPCWAVRWIISSQTRGFLNTYLQNSRYRVTFSYNYMYNYMHIYVYVYIVDRPHCFPYTLLVYSLRLSSRFVWHGNDYRDINWNEWIKLWLKLITTVMKPTVINFGHPSLPKLTTISHLFTLCCFNLEPVIGSVHDMRLTGSVNTHVNVRNVGNWNIMRMSDGSVSHPLNTMAYLFQGCIP